MTLDLATADDLRDVLSGVRHRVFGTDRIAVMRKAILGLVRSEGAVSMHRVAQLPNARGERALMGGRGVLLWDGLSRDATAAIISLRDCDALRYLPAPWALYVAEGAVPDLPRVRSAASLVQGFARPHWLPVVLVAGPAAADG